VIERRLTPQLPIGVASAFDVWDAINVAENLSREAGRIHSRLNNCNHVVSDVAHEREYMWEWRFCQKLMFKRNIIAKAGASPKAQRYEKSS
jgi:hypothetical protein